MASKLNFSGNTVLVVGGSSGIGNGIAQGFRACGATVHVWGTRPSADDYRGIDGSDLGGLSYTQVDVSSANAIAAAPLPGGPINVLVQSQGAVRYRRQEFEMDGWQEVIDINLSSIMQIAMRCEDAIKAAGGSMIIVSSVGAFTGLHGNPAYAASKAGAVSLVKTFAKAWAADGVRVNGLAPSLVDTKMTKVTMDNPERRARSLAEIPLNRFGTIEEMAGVALFLASPLAGYVTGQTVIADGGMTC
ncbi:SDR family oxidoreductase (plasmid) [Sphingobium sp. JS3065]|uniref:SDR family NAD(P)-dependent oxidoreductase n=1 Tax=Sphingobium sp. JS3065 TaxID=2970925 RepID=UPI0022648ED1|nr:SDR family oxidoreductase [Sphingobium sp. JS3065]UZW58336.1 SDR family oxidoreductase [Sphingobium sp. JS3065]